MLKPISSSQLYSTCSWTITLCNIVISFPRNYTLYPLTFSSYPTKIVFLVFVSPFFRFSEISNVSFLFFLQSIIQTVRSYLFNLLVLILFSTYTIVFTASVHIVFSNFLANKIVLAFSNVIILLSSYFIFSILFEFAFFLSVLT